MQLTQISLYNRSMLRIFYSKVEQSNHLEFCLGLEELFLPVSNDVFFGPTSSQQLMLSTAVYEYSSPVCVDPTSVAVS